MSSNGDSAPNINTKPSTATIDALANEIRSPILAGRQGALVVDIASNATATTDFSDTNSASTSDAAGHTTEATAANDNGSEGDTSIHKNEEGRNHRGEDMAGASHSAQQRAVHELSRSTREAVQLDGYRNEPFEIGENIL